VNSARLSETKQGFTLVELLVVFGVIGILAALLVPVLSRSKQKSRGDTAQAKGRSCRRS